jgi:hypothetical protein
MKLLENEEILWESENKSFILTSCRFRLIKKVFMNDTIKSIMLENISSCELNSSKDYGYIRNAILLLLGLNGGVYLLNQYFFNSVLIQEVLGDISIPASLALGVFIVSAVLAILNLILFFHSVKKIFSVHSNSLSISVELKSLKFEEREFFLSRIEEAMDRRRKKLVRN